MPAPTDKTASVLVRIPKRTLRAIDRQAKREQRSRNSQIVAILADSLKRDAQPAGPLAPQA